MNDAAKNILEKANEGYFRTIHENEEKINKILNSIPESFHDSARKIAHEWAFSSENDDFNSCFIDCLSDVVDMLLPSFEE